MSDFKDNTIHLCYHCEKVCAGKQCNNCSTKEKRAEMDKVNKEIKPDYVCKVCDLNWYSTMVEKRFEGTIEKLKV
jgi:hypothetical protein